MALKKQKVTPENNPDPANEDILGEDTTLDLSQVTKGYTGLKAVVFILTLAIIVMTVIVAQRAMELLSKPSEDTPQLAETQSNTTKVIPTATAPQAVGASPSNSLQDQLTLSMPEGATLISVTASGDQLVVTFQKAEGGYQIQVISLTQGIPVSVIDYQ